MQGVSALLTRSCLGGGPSPQMKGGCNLGRIGTRARVALAIRRLQSHRPGGYGEQSVIRSPRSEFAVTGGAFSA